MPSPFHPLGIDTGDAPRAPLVFPATRSVRLTGFEFVPATDRPQLVRLLSAGDDRPLITFVVLRWLAVDLRRQPLLFETADALVTEGEGVCRLYWNDEPMPWANGFDPEQESQRITQIRQAVDQMRDRGGSLLAM